MENRTESMRGVAVPEAGAGTSARRKDFGERRLELGEDLKFLLVAVGGGAIQVAKEVAKRDVRYLETVAVNCDKRVKDETMFDRSIYLGHWMGEDLADAGGSPSTANVLAHAAEDELDGLVDGATCVTVVASLGGGSGTGILPVLLDTMTRNPDVVHLTIFFIKPFACEEHRRHLAERALAGLYFIDGLTDLMQKKRVAVITLDNEETAREKGSLPMSHLVSFYGEIVAEHIAKYISLSEIETTLSWMREGEMLGVPNTWTPGEDARVPTGVPLEGPLGVTAYLKSKPVTAPAPARNDVECVIEAVASPKSPPRPKDLPSLP
jgi:hypothetical protein